MKATQIREHPLQIHPTSQTCRSKEEVSYSQEGLETYKQKGHDPGNSRKGEQRVISIRERMKRRKHLMHFLYMVVNADPHPSGTFEVTLRGETSYPGYFRRREGKVVKSQRRHDR